MIFIASQFQLFGIILVPLRNNSIQMNRLIPLIVATILVVGCRSTQDVLYFQNAKIDQSIAMAQDYESKIQRDDILAITVSSKEAEAARPFNKALPLLSTQGASSGQNLLRLTDRGYLVSQQGYIQFPMLGEMLVAGKTKSELSKLIENKLIEQQYLTDPTVSVALLNFKFSVLGESARPNTYSVDSERVTLIEALSMAGDLNINAERDVIIIRESNGTRVIAQVDMRSVDFMNSPYYYIHPNDVIYVRPNQTKVNQSSDRQLLPLITSIASLAVTITTLILVNVR